MVEKLIQSYVSYIHSRFDVEKIDNDTFEIITPFLDRRNDHISFYLQKNGEGLRLTDGGEMLQSLSLDGLEFKSPSKRQELEIALNGFGIFKEQEELYIQTNSNDFAKHMHSFIQALLSVNDLFVLAHNKVTSFFFDEVIRFFEDIGVRYTSNIQIEGKTHLEHKFDFLIPKSKTHSERLIKILNNPKKENLQSNLFAFSDLPLQRRENTDKIIVFNDANTKINDALTQACKEVGIMPLIWSEKEKQKEYLVA
ncbi:DUF1829 domain-containing protein [uncultured Helicobacter sp.]|uniref:DUF1829 domain-containing protein n=1 Tax=uncultured Helicobacter sp. TaxID=175537 RepID=UPI00374F1D1C